MGSRRIRTVGELLANQCRTGLAHAERLVKAHDSLRSECRFDYAQKLINPKRFPQ